MKEIKNILTKSQQGILVKLELYHVHPLKPNFKPPKKDRTSNTAVRPNTSPEKEKKDARPSIFAGC